MKGGRCPICNKNRILYGVIVNFHEFADVAKALFKSDGSRVDIVYLCGNCCRKICQKGEDYEKRQMSHL